MGFLNKVSKWGGWGGGKIAVCLVHREPFLFPFVAEESMEFI